MKSLSIVLILLISVISQTSFWPALGIYGAAPNLVLVFILAWVILVFQKDLSDSRKFWPIILAGLLLDLFSGLPFGVFSLSFIGLTYLVDWLIKNIFSRINFGSLVLLSLAATLFYNLILIILIRLFIPISVLFGSISFKDGSWPVNPYSFYSILLEAVYNTILITLIFYGIKKIFYQKQFR
ncbi:MAG: rod shape-determining protein MreD [Candidatus Portnoybacteria bacterium RIFCSPLOWO2_01_FULL_43_11]|uniref:Rod shape-determining protein MreD n=3 Tax=Candidatus Portnoyibacteriota TaxID=1817913 RepID=A0A1G2FBJ9_9BACT|nr:MAG: rod shape-determining protein MreD [Candidatus Portnoybacteria bacterium RIFCSPHIGHO2_01_FULL_40_12b]OGZ36386.1 MAG: rod shape-determining protein MreD [Candidatus Portnoybacteria bacterium RIFCSPHIGHO2_02_FULL_40_23]OGZ38506.1 MAG: rod shape-determining protein MreD [Candidatus Portnoybacteria bacterium RIFCSPLOWO2_01_FULL_43_11]OGZ40223.1 MAG: rod shape-determining protein MreD [Candidatus Portnoybacteria bacterium RIFCSPLOWO2_02_FULL_40_15]